MREGIVASKFSGPGKFNGSTSEPAPSCIQRDIVAWREMMRRADEIVGRAKFRPWKILREATAYDRSIASHIIEGEVAHCVRGELLRFSHSHIEFFIGSPPTTLS